MKTAMQELISGMEQIGMIYSPAYTRAKELLSVEKEQIIEAFKEGETNEYNHHSNGMNAILPNEYFNSTFKNQEKEK